jgi:hypothetical protein
MNIPVFRIVAVSAILLGLVCLTAVPAQAGQLDKGLLKKSGHILYYLSDAGYKNVGVLPFEVEKGERKASSKTSPLALNLATRLENTLIMSQDPTGKTIGIIRAASATAAQNRVGNYQTSATAFRKLFEQSYPLAWGNKKVKVNAFLTGRVLNKGKDRSKTTVIVEAFDANSRKDGKLVKEKVCEFEVPTDRALLADLGYSWSLSPVVLRRGYTPGQRDRLAIRQVASRDEEGEEKPQPGQKKAYSPENIAGFTLKVYYNDQPQEITPLSQRYQGGRLPLYQVPPAPPGAKITMSMTRTDESDRVLGVVLKLNGQSSWQREDAENIRCKKWIYESARTGKPDWYRGFYTDTTGKNLLEWKSLTPEASEEKAREMGARVGWIDIEVFASSQGPKPEEDDQVMQVSTRSVGKKAIKRGSSLKEVGAALRKANNARVKLTKLPFEAKLTARRNLIDAEVEPMEGGEIEEAELPNAESLGAIAIRYWDRKKDE